MKTILVMIAAILVLASNSYSQKAVPWDRLSALIGEWQGTGGGEPGNGNGVFTFKYDLGQKVLVRRSHAEYPAREGEPVVVHDDLMITYLDAAGVPSRAIYFDNEGHTINYSIIAAVGSIVFLSDKAPKAPVFRLTYFPIDEKTMNVRFETSRDGQRFAVYVEGKCTKVK
jgi:hypothetical protein